MQIFPFTLDYHSFKDHEQTLRKFIGFGVIPKRWQDKEQVLYIKDVLVVDALYFVLDDDSLVHFNCVTFVEGPK